MNQERELAVNDIVRLGCIDGSLSDGLYLIAKVNEDNTVVLINEDGVNCGPFQKDQLHYQKKPIFLQLMIDEEKQPIERELIINTGFMTFNQLKEMCRTKYNATITGASDHKYDKIMLTYYSRKGYICEHMKRERMANDTDIKHCAELYLKYEPHKARNYLGYGCTHIMKYKAIGYNPCPKWELREYDYCHDDSNELTW